MTPAFKPGDVCVVIDSPCTDGDERLLIGKECTVVGLIDDPLARLMMFVDGYAHQYFTVRMADGETLMLCHNSLRKKQPPKEKGSWLTIEKITGWLPKVEPRAVPA